MKANLSLILGTFLIIFTAACAAETGSVDTRIAPTRLPVSTPASNTSTPTLIPIASPTMPAPTITPTAKTDLVGSYTVVGTNLAGAGYEGEASITRNDPWYDITWTIGNETYTGFGILDGEILHVRWITPDCQGRGMVRYSLYADGTLDGSWTVEGQPGEGTETLKPMH